MEQEAIVCTNDQEQPAAVVAAAAAGVATVEPAKGATHDVSDREIRALCLPDHHHNHHHSADEDSDGVVLDGGDTVIIAPHQDGDLLLAESTSSSPILTGISHHHHHSSHDEVGHVAELGAWQLNRAFGHSQAEHLETLADDESAEPLARAEAVLGTEQGDAACSEENGVFSADQQKCGLSRCVANGGTVGTGSPIDGAAEDANEAEVAHQREGENDECTCRDEVEAEEDGVAAECEGGRPPTSAKCDAVDSGDDGAKDNYRESEPEDAIATTTHTNQSEAVQSTDSGSVANATTTAASGDNEDDDPLFYSVVNDSGPSGSAGNGSSSGVLTKQQTPTSVRTATNSAVVGGGGGSFGKSESQLENPKILSKRLQRLFRVLDDDKCVGEPSMGNGEKSPLGASAKIPADVRSKPGPSSAPVNSATVTVKEEDPEVAELPEGQQDMDVDPERPAAEDADEPEEEESDRALNNNNPADEIDAPVVNENHPPAVLPQDFEQENTWADCEEVGDESEEVCTCQNYSDTEDVYDEDEQLPSKDVDLSSFTSHDLLQEASENNIAGNVAVAGTTTTPLGPGRKRKISEAGSSSGLASVDSPSCGNQLYLDVVQSKRCRGGKYSSSNIGSPKTPTSSVAQIPAFLRTPRSAQSMHLMPRESLSSEMGLWLGQFQKWNEFDRVTALNHIIDLCEPSQVRHVMKVIEPQFQRDFISLLPRELALQVLSYLDPTDLLRAAQTCRNWRFLCDDNLLWKDKCKEGNIIIDTESDRPKRGRAGNMPPIASPWKAAYMRQHIIEMNWRSRPIRTPKVLKGHDDHVITCLQFCGNRIVSGSDDNTLKVWSAVTGKCLRVLVGHTGGVWSSQMSSKYIISGSTDRTLKVWNADTGHCEHTLYGHTSTVRCMHLHGEKVVSGSRDATLRVWDVNRGTCLHVLVGHLAAVRCVQYDGKLVVSGAYDYTVKVWNPERQECLHTLQGHTNRVYSLQFDGIHVVSGSLDTSIRVWDAESGSCKHTLMGHQSLTSGMELRDHILVSGNADSTVRIWDIVSGQCLQTLSGPNKHQSAVTCLQFNSRFVITSSDDGTVKLWDVKTGEFIRNLVALDSGGSGGVVWRIRASDTKLICAVGSRNGTEETKLMVLDFDVEGACLKCS